MNLDPPTPPPGSAPSAHSIEGLTFRPFRDDADFALMADVTRESRAADRIAEVDTAESLERLYSNFKNFNLERDIIIAEVGGKFVGYRHCVWWERVEGSRLYHHFGFLLPGWRGKGIEREIVHRCEAHLHEIASEHPPCERLLDTFMADTETEMEAVVTSEGYAPVRYFIDMVRPDLEDIPDLPLPAGLEVRPVQPEHYRAIWEAEVEAFQNQWGESRVEEADFERWKNRSSFQPHLWQVAWDGDQVAGMVRTCIDEEYNSTLGKKRGFTENISTRQPWRKRGLASALIARSLRLQKELGMTESTLGVDTENPSGALRVYERMGFRPVQRFTVYHKPM